MITPLLGTSFIGYSRSTGTEPCGNAVQPGTGTKLEPAYMSATPAEVDHAMALAAAAFPV
jgi:alpha-ketoglutaric semialdehyde dehydrogenase